MVLIPITTLTALIIGSIAGLVTGLTPKKIPILLAGILVMTAALSINLRMGSANISLLNQKSIFFHPTTLTKNFDSVLLALSLLRLSHYHSCFLTN